MQVALKQPTPDQPVERPIIDVERPKGGPSIDTTLMKMVAATKSSPLKIMREYTALGFGPGRVSFSEFYRLRLFDDAYYGDADKREVVGWGRNSQINLIVNYRYDWWGMLADKIASASFLAAYGFPVIPALMIYAKDIGRPSPGLARSEAELRAFLTNEENYPLFGKPIEGLQSLGSIALRRYIAAERSFETIDGRMVALDDVVADLTQHYGNGYVFQKFQMPHAGVRALCGDRLATVRIVTIVCDGKPTVFRACWKIPGGTNTADNYWRAGNMLAQLDLAQGRIVRAMSGAGLDLVEHTQHPATGAALVGAQVPQWDAMVNLVLDAARLMRHVPMIGWDVAALDAGPVIVEMNETPDFFLNQLADRRGVLDAEFKAFMEQQKKGKTLRVKTLRETQGA